MARFVFIVAVFVLSVDRGMANTQPLLVQVRKQVAVGVDDLGSQAVDLLAREIETCRAALPEDMRVEFDTAVKRRLEEILAIPSQCVTSKYARCRQSLKVFELATQVALEDVRNHRSRADRLAAKEQLSRLIGHLQSTHSKVHKEVYEVAVPSILTSLSRLQWDVFDNNYGVPLTADEFSKLESVISQAVAGLIQISDSVSGERLPPEKLSKVARLTTKASGAVFDFFLQRQTPNEEARLAALSAWRNSTKDLDDALAAEVRQSERSETEAIGRKLDAQADANTLEDSPEVINAKKVHTRTVKNKVAS